MAVQLRFEFGHLGLQGFEIVRWWLFGKTPALRAQVYKRPTGTSRRLETSVAECSFSRIYLTASVLNSAVYWVRFMTTPSTHS